MEPPTQTYFDVRERREAVSKFKDTLKGSNRILLFKTLVTAHFEGRVVTWADLPKASWPGVNYNNVKSIVAEVQRVAAAWGETQPLQITVEAKCTTKPNGQSAWSLNFVRNRNHERICHRLRWSCGDSRGTLPTKVLLAAGNALEVHCAPADPWHFPAQLLNETSADYSKRRENLWGIYESKRANDHRPPPSDTVLWHVAGDSGPALNELTGNLRVYLIVRQLSFKDYVSTTMQLDQKSPHTKTYRAWFQSIPKPFPVPHFSTANANVLSVDVNVITSDKKLVFRRQKPDGPWETAIYAHINALEDVHRDDPHICAPRETAFRWGCQLFGIQINPASVKWLGVSLSAENGNVSILGEVEVPFTFDKLKEYWERRTDKGRSYEVMGQDFYPPNILTWLEEEKKSKPIRHHMEAAIMLSLNKGRFPTCPVHTESEPYLSD